MPLETNRGPGASSTHGRTAARRDASNRERLNPECAAVEDGVAGTIAAGPLLVIAGAESGKTNTLAHRAAHLIVDGADPGDSGHPDMIGKCFVAISELLGCLPIRVRKAAVRNQSLPLDSNASCGQVLPVTPVKVEGSVKPVPAHPLMMTARIATTSGRMSCLTDDSSNARLHAPQHIVRILCGLLKATNFHRLRISCATRLPDRNLSAGCSSS